MLSWRLLKTSFFSISVKHLCLCCTVNLCACVCVCVSWIQHFVRHISIYIITSWDSPPKWGQISLWNENECTVSQYTGCVCLRIHVLKNSQWNSAPLNTCSCMRKSLSHTCQSLLHKCQPARCSFKKGFFLVCAPFLLHWGFASQITISLSHVLAERPTGTFYQSVVWDGSSRIILTVEPARIRLYDATHTHTYTHTATKNWILLDIHAGQQSALAYTCNIIAWL